MVRVLICSCNENNENSHISFFVIGLQWSKTCDNWRHWSVVWPQGGIYSGFDLLVSHLSFQTYTKHCKSAKCPDLTSQLGFLVVWFPTCLAVSILDRRWVETVVNGVTKSSGQGSTGVLAPIREWPPGGWRGKRGRGRDSQGSQGAPLTGFGDEKRGRQIREKLKGSCGLVADKKELNILIFCSCGDLPS